MEKKRWLLGALVAGLLFTSAGIAGAQAVIPEDMDLNYTLNVGAAFSISDKLDNGTFPTIGISWFGSAPENVGRHAALGISADWIPVERNDNTTVQMVPLLINYRQYGHVAGYRIFTTLGAGISANTDSIPEIDMDNGVNFAWNVGIGLDISNKLNVQGRFLAGNHPADDGMAMVTLGYRF